MGFNPSQAVKGDQKDKYGSLTAQFSIADFARSKADIVAFLARSYARVRSSIPGQFSGFLK
jgi:hypothetical protein